MAIFVCALAQEWVDVHVACAKTRELVVSFSVPCTWCTSCSLPAEVHVSKFDIVEFLYCAGYGTWRLLFDVLHGLVRELAGSCLLAST